MNGLLLKLTQSQTFLASIIFLAIISLLFWPFFLRGEIIAPTDLLFIRKPWSLVKPENYSVKNDLRSDIVDNSLPGYKFFQEEIKKGNLPLWIPRKSQGAPFFFKSDFLNPLSGSLLLIFPLPYAFSFIVISKLFLMGIFTFLFLKRLKLSFWPAIIGSVIYMLSGFNTFWLSWTHTLVTSFTPLLFLVTENLVRRPEIKNSLILGVVVAIMGFANFPAVAGYAFYATGLYFLMRVGQQYLQDKDQRLAFKTGLLFALGFIVSAALFAIQLLPSLEFFKFINIAYRKAQALEHLPLKSAIQIIFPNYWGNNVFHNWKGASNFGETAGYIGIIPLLLLPIALIGGIKKKNIRALFFSILALASLSVVYNVGPLLHLIHNLPIFSTSPNTRLLSLFGFGGAVAAAFGLQFLTEAKPRFLKKNVLWILAVVITFALTLLVGYKAFELSAGAFASGNLRQLLKLEVFRPLSILLGISLLIGFSWLYLLFSRNLLSKKGLARLSLGLILIDLLIFGFRQNPTVPKEFFYPETPGIEFLENNLKPNERMAPFDGSFLMPGTQLYYGLNSSFSHGFHSTRHKQLIAAFSTDAFHTATSITPNSKLTDFSSPVIDLLGIRYLVFPDGIDADLPTEKYKLVYQRDEELIIYENVDFENGVFLTNHIAQEPNPDGLLTNVSSAEFDPQVTAYIEEDIPDLLINQLLKEDPNRRVYIKEYEANHITYETSSDLPAFLATSELFYPGWKVFVDGKEGKIYRANYIFRGTSLSPGKHEVKFVYDPPLFKIGAVISTSVAFAIALYFLSSLKFYTLKLKSSHFKVKFGL